MHLVPTKEKHRISSKFLIKWSHSSGFAFCKMMAPQEYTTAAPKTRSIARLIVNVLISLQRLLIALVVLGAVDATHDPHWQKYS